MNVFTSHVVFVHIWPTENQGHEGTGGTENLE